MSAPDAEQGTVANLRFVTEFDEQTVTALMFTNWLALDLDNGAYLFRTYGRGKGGLPTYVLIVHGPGYADVEALSKAGFDWKYRSFIRAWGHADALELANVRLQKHLQRTAALSPAAAPAPDGRGGQKTTRS